MKRPVVPVDREQEQCRWQGNARARGRAKWARVLAARVCVLGLMGGSAGCAGSTNGDDRASHVTEIGSGGWPVTRNTAGGHWRDGEAWRLVEELRIGTLDGGGANEFSTIDAVTVDAEGRLWVADQASREIRVFSREGMHVRSIGRHGAGPGEFERIVRLDVMADGTIGVVDPPNGRLTILDTAGRYQAAHLIIPGAVSIPWPGGADGRGGYYVPRFAERQLLRYDTGLTLRDTLMVPRDPVIRERFEAGPLRAVIPFQGRLVWHLAPQGTIWTLVTDRYTLAELGPSGDTLRVITRETTPIPVSNAERARVSSDLAWFTRQGGTVDMSRVPRTKPPVADFVVSEDGHLWVEAVQVVEAVDGDDPVTTFDVFSPDGRYLGAVTAPFRVMASPAPLIRGTALIAVVRGASGAPQLVRARIVRP